jgi:hypothetical protein
MQKRLPVITPKDPYQRCESCNRVGVVLIPVLAPPVPMHSFKVCLDCASLAASA